MTLYKDFLSHVVGINTRSRMLRIAVVAIVIFAGFLTPKDLAQALMNYEHRQITWVVNHVFEPVIQKSGQDALAQEHLTGSGVPSSRP